ncbi:MAG: hypothetical protein ACI9LM_001204 [Alteromonadaceae bacterium]|jgi:hypothetical protein
MKLTTNNREENMEIELLLRTVMAVAGSITAYFSYKKMKGRK